MYPLTNEQLDRAMNSCGASLLGNASIRQICAVADAVQMTAGNDPIIHLEIGNPGLPAAHEGVCAEIEALQNGVASQYAPIGGIPEVKAAGKRFLKSFLNIDLDSKAIIPTVGSMQGSFTLMLLLSQRDAQRDTVLFLNPGFPAQPRQAAVLGIRAVSFDIYGYRGKALEAKLEEMFADGRVTAMIYSNPNNPAWTNLTEDELAIIGRCATRHDVVVLEDLAYMGMDFRSDCSCPGVPPYIPTVARYTDNYVLLMSASKIFSYAGQRIALACFSPSLAQRSFYALQVRYGTRTLIDSYLYGILHIVSSGTSHSAQCAMAAMLDAASEGRLDFVGDCREYGRRANRAKQAFTDNGFHIVYAKDGDSDIADGFFFTAGYPGKDSETLQRDLLRHGVAAISLPGTGSSRHGVRVCVSMLDTDEKFALLNTRLATLAAEYSVSQKHITKNIVCEYTV